MGYVVPKKKKRSALGNLAKDFFLCPSLFRNTVIFTLKNDSNNENFEVTSANCHMSICVQITASYNIKNVYKNSVII
jgi:hypothetical protein